MLGINGHSYQLVDQTNIKIDNHAECNDFHCQKIDDS